MLSGPAVTAAVVGALQTITALVTAMNGDADRIAGHYFYAGTERPLVNAVAEMTPPFVLIVYEAELGGNFDGATLFKHRLALYMRSANMAGVGSPTGIWDLWALICNGAVNGGSHNIRQVDLLSGELLMRDPPNAKLMQDSEGIDYLCGYMTFDEQGDN